MRLATLIIALVLSLGLGIQSCAVSFGGSVQEELSTTQAEKSEGEDTSGSGGLGILAALLWVVAAGFVMSKPRVSMWLFGVAALFCLLGGSDFPDLYVWAVVSVGLGVMSWRGIIEKEKQDLEKQEQYERDVEAAAGRRQTADR